MNILNRLFCLFIAFTQINCNAQGLDCIKETDFGIFHYCDKDTGAINDLVKAAKTNLPRICNELQLTINKPAVVEIYPDQEEYNKHIMNPDLKDSPAISGSGRIQIVSPRAKIKIDMKYEDRLMLLVHEYVHILIDNLDKAPPLFIDEGTASFYSSYNFYRSAAVKYVKHINYIPDIKQLQEHYNNIPAPDLFSFIFIDYIVQIKGKEMLPEILRHTDYLTDDGLNKAWKEYVVNTYY